MDRSSNHVDNACCKDCHILYPFPRDLQCSGKHYPLVGKQQCTDMTGSEPESKRRGAFNKHYYFVRILPSAKTPAIYTAVNTEHKWNKSRLVHAT